MSFKLCGSPVLLCVRIFAKESNKDSYTEVRREPRRFTEENMKLSLLIKYTICCRTFLPLNNRQREAGNGGHHNNYENHS